MNEMISLGGTELAAQRIAYHKYTKHCGRVIGELVKFASTEDYRPAVTMIQAKSENGRLRLTATNGFMLAVVDIPPSLLNQTDDAAEPLLEMPESVLFRGSGMKALGSSLKRGTDTNASLWMQHEDDRVSLTSGGDGVMIQSEPVAGVKFPNIESFIVGEFTDADMNRTALRGKFLMLAGSLCEQVGRPARIVSASHNGLFRIDCGPADLNESISARIVIMAMIYNWS